MRFRVRDRLFIGDINYAAELLQRGSTEVTHVLSLLSSASISFFSEWRSGVSIPTKEIRQGFFGGSPSSSGDDGAQRRILYSLELAGPELKLVRMAVPLRDMENENLLDYLDVCLDFIDESRKEGGSVLVHCFAGVSRSAAVITAYLMKTERLSQEDALESLRQSCDAYNRGEKIDSSKFGADPGLSVEHVSNEAAPNANKPTPAYRCKKCRRVVALQENVINHIPGEGEKCFEWQKWRSGNPFNRSDELECSSIFVEPLQWMKTVEEGALEGKLLCAHCDARLGYFNWSGIQCSCGSWITPAFQLHKSRVDVSTL